MQLALFLENPRIALGYHFGIFLRFSTFWLVLFYLESLPDKFNLFTKCLSVSAVVPEILVLCKVKDFFEC